MSDELKLGDTIDDYCSRCQLLMNHYVVSMVEGRFVRSAAKLAIANTTTDMERAARRRSP